MMTMILIFVMVNLLSLVVGCSLGKLFRVGSGEDLSDLQAGDGNFNGSLLNTPLPSSVRVKM